MVKGSLRKMGRYLGSMDVFPHARSLRLGLARAAMVALVLPLALAALALADPPRPEPSAGEALSRDQQKAQRERDLDAVREEQRNAAEAEAKLRAEIESISEDRGKLNKALIDAAARIRALEMRIAASEGRIKTLDANDRTIRHSLEDRRTVIAEVLAALQRMGRRPP